MRRVGRKLDVKPIIYTNASSWLATGDTTWFATNGHPLWVANYDVAKPLVPAANWAGRMMSISSQTFWPTSPAQATPVLRSNASRQTLRNPHAQISGSP